MVYCVVWLPIIIARCYKYKLVLKTIQNNMVRYFCGDSNRFGHPLCGILTPYSYLRSQCSVKLPTAAPKNIVINIDVRVAFNLSFSCPFVCVLRLWTVEK